MKLIDIINNVDKSAKNEDTSVRWDMELFMRELNYSQCNWTLHQPENNIRLRCYWAANHICTDTWVGIRLYFLDDVFVALSTQSARKSDEILEWKDKQSADDVLNYIRSIDTPEEIKEFTPLNLEEELGDGYPIGFTEQMLVKEVLYNGELVKVTEDNGNHYKNFHNIKIVGSDGIEKQIDVRDILVPWYVKKEN